MLCECARCTMSNMSTGGCTVCTTWVYCSLCNVRWCGIHFPNALEEHYKAVHEPAKEG